MTVIIIKHTSLGVAGFISISMELKQAYELLKQAHDEYTEATAFENIMRGVAKRNYTRKKEILKDRIQSIFDLCPNLWTFAPDYFFSPTAFDTDFDMLMLRLKEELENDNSEIPQML